MTTAAAMTDEEARVRQVVEQIPLPGGVKLKAIQLDSDWEGEPAWRIYFAVPKKTALTKSFIRSLTNFKFLVVDQVTELRTGKFPYVEFTESR